jgi:hypothetical protein
MSEDEKAIEKPESQEPSQSIERIPEPIKGLISSVFASRQPVFPPFMEKINEQHIDKVLDYSEKQDERDFTEAQSERRIAFIRFLVIVGLFVFLFVFLTIYLVDRDKELYKDILKVALGALGGLAAGYGLGKRSVNKDDE